MKKNKISQSITDRTDISVDLYLKDISHCPTLSIEEEDNVIKLAKNGSKKAKELLIKSNLRFVVSIAKQYQYNGLPLADLIQEGNIGLLTALDKFDGSLGFRFISYAVWWIRQSIIKALSDYSRTIKAPVSQVLIINKLNKLVDKAEQEENRSVSIDELATKLNIKERRIAHAYAAYSKSINIESDNDFGSVIDTMPDGMFKQADDSMTDAEVKRYVNSALNRLTKKERDIIKRSFGINCYPMTVSQIAHKYNVSIERIRQVKKNTLRKLKRILRKTVEG